MGRGSIEVTELQQLTINQIFKEISLSNNKIRLFQKKNLITFLYNLSLKIEDLSFVEDYIYGTDSYLIATQALKAVPNTPLCVFYDRPSSLSFIENFIIDVCKNETSYYVVLEPLLIYDSESQPKKPILLTKAEDLENLYRKLLILSFRNELLLCSTDFRKGIYIDVYADQPTYKNSWYDGAIYECYQWLDQ